MRRAENATESLASLNAFTVVGKHYSTRETNDERSSQQSGEKGYTQKERKSNARRKTKSGTIRQPRQLSLDVRTIKTLDAMKVNNSDLFETLLQQYNPFLDTWAEMGYGSYQEDKDK